MTITPHEKHHSEITEPDVWTETCAGTLTDVHIELPDCMVDLTPDEAERLRDALADALFEIRVRIGDRSHTITAHQSPWGSLMPSRASLARFVSTALRLA